MKLLYLIVAILYCFNNSYCQINESSNKFSNEYINNLLENGDATRYNIIMKILSKDSADITYNRIIKGINYLESKYKYVFLILNHEKFGYSISFIGTNKENPSISGLNVSSSGRVVEIKRKLYYLIFNTDNRYGYIEIIQEGEKYRIMYMPTTVYDDTIDFDFDEEWNEI